MQRFSELYFKGGSLVQEISDKFIATLNSEGAFCVGGNTKVPLDFQIAGGLLESQSFYGGDKPDLEETLRVFMACKKGKFVVVNGRTFITYNAKALYFLSCYGSAYGYDTVDEHIRDLCSGFFTMINGDTIGAEINNKTTFISDKGRGHLKLMLGDVVFWLARSVTVNTNSSSLNVLKGILPFFTNKAEGMCASPDKVGYAAAVVLNRKAYDPSDSAKFLHILLDSVEATLKMKTSVFTLISLSTFVYVIEAIETPITLKLRVSELKDKAIQSLLSVFKSFSKFVSKKISQDIASLEDMETLSFMVFAILGYDTLRSLSPIVWYSDRVRECKALETLFDGIKLNPVAREDIIKEIAKCVM